MATLKWHRFASAFPRRMTALLAGFLALQCLCWWAWFAPELRPLERYYLIAYFHSTEDAKRAGTKTRIEPLFKTAPGRKRELVLAPDVISGRGENMPLQLSQSALEQGWTGIEKGPSVWDDSVEVEYFLRDDFYQNRGFWQLAAEPLLYSCTFLLASITLAFFIRKELTAEWRDLWTTTAELESPLDYGTDSPADRLGIIGRTGLPWGALKRNGKLASKLSNPSLRSGHDISANPPSTSAPEPASVRFPTAASNRHQQADFGPQGRLLELFREGSTWPVEGRRVFPGKGDIRSLDQQPKAWDESQWID